MRTNDQQHRSSVSHRSSACENHRHLLLKGLWNQLRSQLCNCRLEGCRSSIRSKYSSKIWLNVSRRSSIRTSLCVRKPFVAGHGIILTADGLFRPLDHICLWGGTVSATPVQSPLQRTEYLWSPWPILHPEPDIVQSDISSISTTMLVGSGKWSYWSFGSNMRTRGQSNSNG